MKKLMAFICCSYLVAQQQPLVFAQPPGYTYGKQITINASQVGGSLSFFPVLISLIDSDLRHVASGGHVENANGYDIVFYLADCLAPLSHQIEKYDATSGQYVAWVQLPSLDNTANTDIVLFYGNSSVSTNPSTNGIWGAYSAIWHFSSNSFADATANGNNGTNNGTANATGKIGDCRSFGPSSYINVPFHSSLNVTATFTFQAWINPTVLSSSSGHGIFSKNSFFSDYIFGLDWPQGANDALNCWLFNSTFTLYQGGTVPIGQWSHVAATFDGSNVRLYINGSLSSSTARTVAVAPTNTGLVIGQGNGGLASNFVGLIDEPRISPVAQDDAWLLTEYNNQNNPVAFYAVSAEITAAEACGLVLPVELLDFQAKPNENNALLTWRTASEQNNQGFFIEKSLDGRQFESIGFVVGNGFSNEEHRYFFEDKNFLADAYYRLRQLDFDGKNALSPVVFLAASTSSPFAAYPIPATNEILLKHPPGLTGPFTILLFDVGGRLVFSSIVTESKAGTSSIDLKGLPPGTYFLRLRHSSVAWSGRILVGH